MADPLHPLLLRQLRRIGITEVPAQVPDGAAWAQLLSRVSRAYAEADQDRYLLERSQEVASLEMGELNASLEASKARLASLLSLSTDWIWELDAELRFRYVSDHVGPEGAQIARLLLSRHLAQDLTWIEPSDPAVWRATFDRREPFRDYSCSIEVAPGHPVFLRISGEPAFEGGTFVGYRGVGSDVTQATKAEHRVRHLASFDSLTGLLNRSMFMACLEDTIAQAHAVERQLVVMFIDLDRFKFVNDSLGHEAGDELLKAMAMRFKGLLRDSDTVARIGGDEFVVLLQGAIDADELASVARRVLDAASEPVLLSGRPVQVSASVGIARFPVDGGDAAALLRSADTAMYLAKSRGKNNFQLFTSQLSERVAEHLILEGEMRDVAGRGELRLHYQPKFAVQGGQMVGLEALVRWQNPTRGLLMPGEFIALAEESGLIVPIGRWVLHEACRQMREWRRQGLLPLQVSVNISARQFDDDGVITDVKDALASSGIEAAALELELTESMLMMDPERSEGILKRLRELGVHIAIDDFGTGYSSLAYLKRFPANTLKIDRTFVDGLPSDNDDSIITQAVVALAHGMGMQVVAEGVETEAQLQFLQDLGCDHAQGYLLARPMAPADVQHLLTRSGAARKACEPSHPPAAGSWAVRPPSGGTLHRGLADRP